jgi:hypothetical protein
MWGERLRPLGTPATNWPVVSAPDDRWWWTWSSLRNKNWQRKLKYWIKSPRMFLCPLQIQHDLTWVQNRASTVGNWWLTSWAGWAMARPLYSILLHIVIDKHLNVLWLLRWKAVHCISCISIRQHRKMHMNNNALETLERSITAYISVFKSTLKICLWRDL